MDNISVDCSNLDDNPKCLHGPTFKYTEEIDGNTTSYFACSYFNRIICPFYKSADEIYSLNEKLQSEETLKKEAERIRCAQTNYSKVENKILEIAIPSRRFCKTCFLHLLPEDEEHRGHKIVTNISEDMLSFPISHFTEVIKGKHNPTNGWISDDSKQFIIDMLKHFHKRFVLCVGAPSIFEGLNMDKKKFQQPILLDIDKKYHSFYSKEEFISFNMCNFHFPVDEKYSLNLISTFLNAGSNVAIVVEPPLQFNVEALANTIKKLTADSLPKLIILIAPYFLESQIAAHLPDFKMLDFRLVYNTNLKSKRVTKYQRLFVSGPVKLNETCRKLFGKDHWFCKICNGWKSHENQHCHMCNSCTSKSGQFYNHCNICRKCVPSNITHCLRCKICINTKHECQNDGQLRDLHAQPIKKLKKHRLF